MLLKSLHMLNNKQYSFASSTGHWCHWQPQSLGYRQWQPGLSLPQAHFSFSCWSFSKNCSGMSKGSKVGPGNSQGEWPGRAGMSLHSVSAGAHYLPHPPTWNAINSFISYQSPSLAGHWCNSEAHVSTRLLWALPQLYSLQQSGGRRGPGQLSMVAQKPRRGPFQFDLLRHSRCKMKSERWNLSNFLLLFFLDSILTL